MKLQYALLKIIDIQKCSNLFQQKIYYYIKFCTVLMGVGFSILTSNILLHFKAVLNLM